MVTEQAEHEPTDAEHADNLARVLHKAGEQFAFYAAGHRKRGDGDAMLKAATNQAWADRCFAACEAWEGRHGK